MAAIGGSVNLAWNANPESDIAGYRLHYGTTSGVLGQTKDVGKTTTATLTNLAPATTYYCAVQAYNTLDLTSELSTQISFTTAALPNLGVTIAESGVSNFPGNGGQLSLGSVNLGALSETRTFTITNLSSTTLTGLSLFMDATTPENFIVSGSLPVTKGLSINGSFEAGLNPWKAEGNVRVKVNPAATHGSQIVDYSAGDSENNGILRQSIATNPGSTYVLFFDLGVLSNNTNPQVLQATVTGAVTLLNQTITVNGGDGGSTLWFPQSFTFVADSSVTTLSFADVSTSTTAIDLLLDHVRLIEQAVPAASSGGPLISSLAPGKSVSFSVTFMPTAAGTSEAVLSLTATGMPVGLFDVGLSGSGSQMFDAWLASKGASGGANGNPDGDGLNNLLEYAFGTDPGKAGPPGAVIAGSLLVARGTPMAHVIKTPAFEFQGRYCRRKDHKAVRLDYRPQFSSDLITWHDAAAAPVMVADDGEVEMVSVKAPATIDGETPRFFRVGVNHAGPPSFAEWQVANNAAGGPFENPDGDALNNLQEYAFGTDAKIAQGRSVAEINGLIASRGAPAVRVGVGPEFKFSGLFGRRKNHAEAGLDYRPQFSADLVTWVDAGTAPVILADDGEMEVVSATPPAQIDGKPARFFRVGVSQQP